MSLENRKRQYAMFMERGETNLAEDQLKAHPELMDEINVKPKEEPTPTTSKSKKGK